MRGDEALRARGQNCTRRAEMTLTDSNGDGTRIRTRTGLCCGTAGHTHQRLHAPVSAESGITGRRTSGSEVWRSETNTGGQLCSASRWRQRAATDHDRKPWSKRAEQKGLALRCAGGFPCFHLDQRRLVSCCSVSSA